MENDSVIVTTHRQVLKCIYLCCGYLVLLRKLRWILFHLSYRTSGNISCRPWQMIIIIHILLVVYIYHARISVKTTNIIYRFMLEWNQLISLPFSLILLLNRKTKIKSSIYSAHKAHMTYTWYTRIYTNNCLTWMWRVRQKLPSYYNVVMTNGISVDSVDVFQTKVIELNVKNSCT